MNRRELLKTLGATGVTLATSLPLTEAGAESQKAKYDPTQPPPPGSHPRHDMRGYGIPTERQQIAMLAYPNMTALDLVGPHQIFSKMGNAEIHLVAKTHDLVSSDTDLALQPTATFADCPDNLTVLFVPGGLTGTADVIQDGETLEFLAHKARTAQYITSVCTGSLVLGAAGLLKGYKATSHWVARDLLTSLGAKPVKARVVRDRNRITGAGVTAGLDFALYLVSLLRNDKMAKAIQLAYEYDPQPPFHAGTLETAPPAVAQMEWAMNVYARDALREAAQEARKRWK